MDTDEPGLRQAIEELERIASLLESGELELEESIAYFERGTELTVYCQEKLNASRMRVELLLGTPEEGVEARPFEPPAP